ncbi:thioredoxin family protein [Paenibacillus sp. sgz500958]|uniref:thioredoxin family protein n=1 Tax=Paenibacillus sp. sgz500958 TaxID=3242475 RepID=UPI0036D42BE8
MTMLHADSASALHNQLQLGGTVLVEYGAPWCAPCRTLMPILEELDHEYGNEISIVEVNCDELPELASEAGVMGLPTVVIYKGGVPVEKLVGLRPKAAYEGILNKTLTA